MIVFSGNSNIPLAKKITSHLHMPLGKALVSQFSDGECRVEIQENVRGEEVAIVQSTGRPANDHVMELLLLGDALRRASASRITAVIPYFGYARQDKRILSAPVPISAKLIADLLIAAGIDRVITVDLHAEQIQGFFAMPVDNLYASKILAEDVMAKGYANPLVVSPDVGGVVRAREFAREINETDLAIIDKQRTRPNEVQVMNVIGEVNNRICIIVDDMVDTAGTLCEAAKALKEKGATKVVAYCTHPILSGKAIPNIEASLLDELVITDTISLNTPLDHSTKIRQLSVAPLLAQTLVY